MKSTFDYFAKKRELSPDDALIQSACAAYTHKKMHSPLTGESFCIVEDDYRADLKVYFTESEIDADILVFLTPVKRFAKGRETIWYNTDKEYLAETLIYPVEQPYLADISVCITDREYLARWLRKKDLTKKGEI